MDTSRLPKKLPFSKKPLRARVVISYILDYVILVGLVIGFFILDRVEPFHQPFALENFSLHYPYAVHERVPIPLALALSGGFPILVIATYTLLIDGVFSHHSPRSPKTGRRKLMGPYRFKDRLWELNCGVLGLLLAQAAAFVITGALKNACGKPRPDIIDRCQPNPDVHLGQFQLANSTICTQTDPLIMKDGFRSFPSGHSSSSFAGLFYLSLYVSGKLHVLDSRGEVWKTFLVMCPTLGAGLIATTRIMDARHHPFDVISGSLIGVLCAWGSYRQYFPSITEPWRKGRAYPIRTWATVSKGPSDPDRLRLIERELDVQPDEEQSQKLAGAGGATTTRAGYVPQSSRDSSPDHGIASGGSGSHGAAKPFEPAGPHPYLRRTGTDMPSNYSESSSEGPDDDHPIELQPGYGGRGQTGRFYTPQATRDEAFEASRPTEPLSFPRDTAYRTPPPHE